MRALFIFLLCIGSAYGSPAAITLYGNVNANSAHQVIGQIQDANRDTKNHDPILLYINSGGGGLESGAEIIDAMAASRRPIWTVNVGVAASMAAFVFSYGAKKFMLPHSSLLYHDGFGQISGTPQQILSQAQSAIKLSADFESHVAKLAGITMKDYRVKAAAQWIVLADEAVKVHLADGIINPKGISGTCSARGG